MRYFLTLLVLLCPVQYAAAQYGKLAKHLFEAASELQHLHSYVQEAKKIARRATSSLKKENTPRKRREVTKKYKRSFLALGMSPEARLSHLTGKVKRLDVPTRSSWPASRLPSVSKFTDSNPGVRARAYKATVDHFSAHVKGLLHLTSLRRELSSLMSRASQTNKALYPLKRYFKELLKVATLPPIKQMVENSWHRFEVKLPRCLGDLHSAAKVKERAAKRSMTSWRGYVDRGIANTLVFVRADLRKVKGSLASDLRLLVRRLEVCKAQARRAGA